MTRPVRVKPPSHTISACSTGTSSLAVTCFVALLDVPRPSPACARSVTGPAGTPVIWKLPSGATFVVSKNDSTPLAMTVAPVLHPSGSPETVPWIVDPDERDRTRSFFEPPAWRTNSERLLDFPLIPADTL